MTTKPTVETCGAGSHFAQAVEAGRQAYQADAWQDGRCACFAFGWSEGARREEAAEASGQTAGFQPKGESDYICGHCSQVVSWSERFVDVFSDNTPYHRTCWDDRQGDDDLGEPPVPVAASTPTVPEPNPEQQAAVAAHLAERVGGPAVAGREQAVALWERMGRTHDNR